MRRLADSEIVRLPIESESQRYVAWLSQCSEEAASPNSYRHAVVDH